MGSGKGGGGEAAQVRAEEQARQERIRQGTRTINDIFDGGFQVSGKLNPADLTPGRQVFTADGTPVTIPEFSNPAETARRVKGGRFRGNIGRTNPAASPFDAVTSQPLFAERTSKDGFNDEFFAGRRQAFLDFATPQLEDQFGNANKELTFALDRGGLLDSSVRGQKLGELQKVFDLNAQQIADQALGQENKARNDVENARADLISLLNATGDTESAVNSATARAKALSQPGEFSPLANLFSDFTSTLSTQAALERANSLSGGAIRPTFNTGLFAPSAGSVQVK